MKFNASACLKHCYYQMFKKRWFCSNLLWNLILFGSYFYTTTFQYFKFVSWQLIGSPLNHHHYTYNSIFNWFILLTSLTFILAFADVSKNSQLKCLARFIPWSFPTTLSSSKSHLLPTKIIGTCQSSKIKQVKVMSFDVCFVMWPGWKNKFQDTNRTSIRLLRLDFDNWGIKYDPYFQQELRVVYHLVVLNWRFQT